MRVNINVLDENGKEIFHADREIGLDDRVGIEPVHEENGNLLGFMLDFNGEKVFQGLPTLGNKLVMNENDVVLNPPRLLRGQRTW